MAVVVGNFTKDRGLAKANIRYIQQRPNADRETQTRVLFGSASIMGRDEAYQLIDDEAVSDPFFYRLKLSPGPIREDTKRDLDMQELTRSLMEALEHRLNTAIPWVGALHDDHSAIRHVHLLAILPKRLHVPELEFLIREATQTCAEQRRCLDAERARPSRQQPPPYPTRRINRLYNQTITTPHTNHTHKNTMQSSAPAIQSQPSCTCPRCRFTQTHDRQHRIHECVSCGLIMHQGKKLRLHRKEAAWERSR
jgi:hypothetical protein